MAAEFLIIKYYFNHQAREITSLVIRNVLKFTRTGVQIKAFLALIQFKTKNSHKVRVCIAAQFKTMLLLLQYCQLKPDRGSIIYPHASELCDINAPHLL